MFRSLPATRLVFCSLNMSAREMKFALVDFHKLAEIVRVKDIITGRDRSTLNGNEWIRTHQKFRLEMLVCIVIVA